MGRMLLSALAEELGASVLTRNVCGAAEVARAKPDGTTLLLTSMSPIAIQLSFRSRVPYSASSFAPVCLVADAPAVLMPPDLRPPHPGRRGRPRAGRTGQGALRLGRDRRPRPCRHDRADARYERRAEPHPVPRLRLCGKAAC